MKKILICCIALLGIANTYAQRLNWSQKIECPLPDGETVVLYPAIETPSGYYCLPSHLRLSVSDDNQPEFLMMLWGNDGENTVSNGIMHWLLTWGLSKTQEQQVANYLITQIDSSAVLLGTATVTAPEKFMFSGPETALKTLLERSIQTGASIPTTSGGKSATSFKITGPDAETLRINLRKNEFWQGTSVEMPFYDLNGAALCTLQLSLDHLMRQALLCTECFIVPE